MVAPFAEALQEAPESIRPFLVGTLWTRERLWALELPVVTVAVADLESLLDLPWWMDNDVRFCLSPASWPSRACIRSITGGSPRQTWVSRCTCRGWPAG
jgi:hypothetical protein